MGTVHRENLRHQWRERGAGAEAFPLAVNAVNQVNPVTSRGLLDRGESYLLVFSRHSRAAG